MRIQKSMIRLGAAMGAQEAVDACQQLLQENDALVAALESIAAVDARCNALEIVPGADQFNEAVALAAAGLDRVNP